MKKTIYALAAIVLIACKEDKETSSPSNPDKYGSGVYIANEGVFQTGVGTVSYYNPNSKTTSDEIFTEENGFPLGNVLQNIGFANDEVYLVVNNSGTVEVANAGNFKSKSTLSGFSSPRYFTVVNSQKGYITDWFSNQVLVVDLNSSSIVDSIGVGEGPEKVISNGQNAFVANSGAWTRDSIVSVVTISDNSLLKNVVVGDNPQSLQFDSKGSVWVLCSGYADWTDPSLSTAGKLVKLNSNNEVESSLDFSSSSMHPNHLNHYNGSFYFLDNNYNGKVIKMDESATSLPTTPLIDKAFYSFAVNPQNGDIYGTDPKDFNQSGMVYRYDMNGSLLDSFSTGIIPGSISFK